MERKNGSSMTPYEYFIEEGYPSEIAEELAKYLGGYNEQLHNSSEKKNS